MEEPFFIAHLGATYTSRENGPPRITIPLPQIDRNIVTTLTAQSPSIEPPDELITAIESLRLSKIRMQKKSSTSFLVSQRTRIFFVQLRCRTLGVSI